jgi:hypothetical protein
VYQQYVLLNLQQAQHRAEQAEQGIQQERQRAENERTRTERLAARLRALGIDPDAELAKGDRD